MRHHNANRKFGRERNQRRALLRSLARSLIVHETLTTTEAKAKELRPFVEEMVTAARKDTPATRRWLGSRLGGSAASVKKLVDTIAPRYTNRAGGYTRLVRLPRRESDGSSVRKI